MAVVDASVVVDWVAPDADPDGPAGQLLTRLSQVGEPLIAPRIVLEEVANALLTGCRRRRWDGIQADHAFQLLIELPVSLADNSSDLADAYTLSRRYDEHPVYDMLYVALARRLDQPLYTADQALRRKLPDLDFVHGL